MIAIKVWVGVEGKTLMSLSQAPGPSEEDSRRQPPGRLGGRNGGN